MPLKILKTANWIMNQQFEKNTWNQYAYYFWRETFVLEKEVLMRLTSLKTMKDSWLDPFLTSFYLDHCMAISIEEVFFLQNVDTTCCFSILQGLQDVKN